MTNRRVNRLLSSHGSQKTLEKQKWTWGKKQPQRKCPLETNFLQWGYFLSKADLAYPIESNG